MKGFSPLKNKWLPLLLVSTFFLLVLPIFAGAQSEGEGAVEESTEAGGTEAITAEEAVGAAGEAILIEEPSAVVEPAPTGPPPEPVTEAKYNYFILHSFDPDAPITDWDIVDRIPANTSYTYEEPGYFGFFLEPPKDPEAYKEHFYAFESQVFNFKPKKAVYKLSLSQPEVPKEPPVVSMENPSIGEVIEGIESMMTDEPPEVLASPPPADLVMPEGFNVADRKNDQGGVIVITWPSVESDELEHTYTPPPEEIVVPPPPAVEEEVEYQLDVLVIDAWVYYDDLKSPELPEKKNDPSKFDVWVNLTRLGGGEHEKLEFKDFVGKNPTNGYWADLAMHFRGEFKLDGEPDKGKGLLRIIADTPDGRRLSGAIKYRKAPTLPIASVESEEPWPDNRYTHYFKIGIDYSNHEGFPRWVLETTPPAGAMAKANLFNYAKWNSLLYAILLSIAILYFIFSARKGKELFVRRIAGLDHVEEAIGRATEMGKPILYVPGLGYMSDVATIAATNILGQVAKKVARYDSQVLVPCRDAIVMTVCQEVVQEAYIDAGRPDAYNKDSVFFLTDDQFSYTASVDGIMVRDKPATNFFMGMFYAESLILAETGAGTGAIQIAGTDALAQLPFFITACDYTLIGEELYAASAYLSREPLLLGSLKGQDLAKLVFIIITIIGVILATFGQPFLSKLFSSPL